jgi:DNA-binding NtrC family response regulator
VGAREGYFEQAGDGTLFLDEIGDLSLFTQVKLLRVLQQMEFSRLGSNKLIPLRARLIFATHRDLSQLVAEGKFRQDLFLPHQCHAHRVALALRSTRKTFPQIAEHFLQDYSQVSRSRWTPSTPTPCRCCRTTPWPGNVRELENVMQRAIILCPGHDPSATEDLPMPEDAAWTKTSSTLATITPPARSSGSCATTRSSWP